MMPTALDSGPHEDPVPPTPPGHNSRPPLPVDAWAAAIPGNMATPMAMAIGMKEALSGVAGRLAVSLRDEIVSDDAAPVPQRALAVSGAATHVPDTSFQTLIYDLFINSLNRGQAPLAVRFEKSCAHASRKKTGRHFEGSTQSFSRFANLIRVPIPKNQGMRKRCRNFLYEQERNLGRRY
jgi:hypothetical protein